MILLPDLLPKAPFKQITTLLKLLMAHPYLSDINYKQKKCLSNMSLSMSKIWLYCLLHLKCLFLVLQLAPIHHDLKSFTLLKPSQTTKPYRLFPLLKSTWIIILNSHFGIYYALFCGIAYTVITWYLTLIKLHLLQGSLCHPQYFAQYLCTVFKYLLSSWC